MDDFFISGNVHKQDVDSDTDKRRTVNGVESITSHIGEEDKWMRGVAGWIVASLIGWSQCSSIIED